MIGSPGSRTLILSISLSLFSAARAAAAEPAVATEDDPAEGLPSAPSHRRLAPDAPPAWADDAPAPADTPQLRNVEPRTRLYIDGSFAQTGDLSALPDIAGKGRNLRLGIGGSLKWRRFQFDTELPASQATTLDLLPPNAQIQIYDEDKHQTALSIGDLRLGAQWTNPLPVDAMDVVAGFGLRVRVPTHTTRFQFHDLSGNLGTYLLPYYFHIEPAALIGGALGPVSFVMNQGLMLLTGPSGQINGLPVVVPNLYFWDAHYALAWRIFSLLAVSGELNTTIQLNHVSGVDFQRVNDVRAVSVVPGLQLHLGRYRVDALARFGLTRGADLLGVIGYAGTRSFVLRLSRVFD
jgi:hypothetical protein